MEGMGLNKDCWQGRRVLVTGHTGFKGSWVTLWLHRLGAKVAGYALAPPSNPNLFEVARVGELVQSVQADIRDRVRLSAVVGEFQPEIILHFAAQSLVRESYRVPVETFEVNVLGTANLLDAARSCQAVRAVVVVTSDKCYENREWLWPYREGEALGGRDPYSSSKACAELVAAAYRSSFFSDSGSALVATVRAGNVIGGGDWANDRLVPDILRAILSGRRVVIRDPDAVRPWQHVLDPLQGYLMLAERLWSGHKEFAAAWNFGPAEDGMKPVSWIVERALSAWGADTAWEKDRKPRLHEAMLLRLDSSKARARLAWQPRLELSKAIDWTVEWFRAYNDGREMQQISLNQLGCYNSNQKPHLRASRP